MISLAAIRAANVYEVGDAAHVPGLVDARFRPGCTPVGAGHPEVNHGRACRIR